MSLDIDFKCSEVLSFHEKLEQPGWHINDIGVRDERVLLERFHHVINAYQQVDPSLQTPIRDIAREMGKGMAEFIRRTEPIQTIDEYERYCFYVAGLVGHGLSQLFVASGLEQPILGTELGLAKSMGLFLQKVNIIRDYLEDISEKPPRIFWPMEIWGKFTSDFHLFKDSAHRTDAVRCLNTMIADAVKHIPDCLQYLSLLNDPKIFQFCAIPQTMAIATLSAVYNNGEVFTGNVKISKGLACRLILDSREMSTVRTHFRRFLSSILERADKAMGSESDNALLIARCRQLVQQIDDSEEKLRAQQISTFTVGGGSSFLSAVILTFWNGLYASAVCMVDGIFGKRHQ
jgi:farnesyl-diphosphate farnesyltransferase